MDTNVEPAMATADTSSTTHQTRRRVGAASTTGSLDFTSSMPAIAVGADRHARREDRRFIHCNGYSTSEPCLEATHSGHLFPGSVQRVEIGVFAGCRPDPCFVVDAESLGQSCTGWIELLGGTLQVQRLTGL